MKEAQLLLAGLALAALPLCACSGEEHGSDMVASQATTPAASPATAQAAPVQAAPAGEAAAAPARPDPAQDPANARGGGKRYQGSADSKLQTDYDLSKVKVDEAVVEVQDGHEGHDHPAPQDGRSLLPEAQAAKNKGRFELADGVQQVHDLGKLRQGDVGSFEFPFVSQGEEPLVITGVKPSCGCTKAEIVLVDPDGTRRPYTKGEPIPVGQRFVLESEISTDGKPGGPFNAQISLYGNDIRGAFNVRLTAQIEPVLLITPSPTIFFGKLNTASKAEQSVTVSTTRGEPFLLTLSGEPPPEPVKLEYAAKNPDAEGKSNEWEIKVAFGPNAKVGMNSYPLPFSSDILIAHPKYPAQDGVAPTHGFMLNVQAHVTGMVSAEPTFLTFGMVKPGEPIERTLRIECHDDFKLTADVPVTFEGLQGQPFPFADAFEVAFLPLEEGKMADLKVRLKGLPPDLNGSFGGVLRIKVAHPYMDELQIRFSGVCRPALPTAAAPPAPNGQK